jgi:hypothetical protein
MAKKILLCASALHLSAAVWNGRRLTVCRGFEHDEAGQRAFLSFLRASPGVPVYLTADTVEEDYRFETLPHAFGSDRRELVERKLRQLYRSTPFYGASLQQRDRDKRRDDRYLFAALTNGEVFSPWLQLLVEVKAPIAGVFPLPVVSVALLKRLGLDDPQLLIVSKHSAGLRQTFVKDQSFRISRLTATRDGEHRPYEAYAEEIRNTRMYLDALNVTHVDDAVTVLILDPEDSLGALEDAVAAGRRSLRAMRLGPTDLVAKIGIDKATLQSSGDALPLYLLGLETPEFNLAPPTLTAGYSRLLASRAIYAVTALAALAGLAWCGLDWYFLAQLKQDTQEIIAQTQREQSAYQEITRTFPPAPAGAERLRQSVEVAKRIEDMARLPDKTYQVVSQGLDANPALSMAGMTWRYGKPSTSAAEPATQLAQSALLQILLVVQPGEMTGATDTVNKFVKDLSRHEWVAAARTVKLPVDAGSGATLRGSTADSRKEQPVKLQFEVEVVLKAGV